MRTPVFIFQLFEKKGCAWPDFRHKPNSGHGSEMARLPAQAKFRTWL